MQRNGRKAPLACDEWRAVTEEPHVDAMTRVHRGMHASCSRTHQKHIADVLAMSIRPHHERARAKTSVMIASSSIELLLGAFA